MRILVVGAGASYAEGEAAGLPKELWPPLISSFARQLWSDYNPHYLLGAFLESRNVKPSIDARAVFLEREAADPARFNVEQFFEFAWLHKNHFPGEWENLLYHGILNPLQFLLLRGLWKGGIQNTPMRASQRVAGHLQPGDLVINLNYDTLFEIGARQVGHKICYLPNQTKEAALFLSKPHGSFNLMVNWTDRSFCFGQVDFPGSPQPANGSKNYIGFVPPRLNKSYQQHPVAHTIVDETRKIARTADVLTFWGVSLTDSDADLLSLFRRNAHTAKCVEFINPSTEHTRQASQKLGVFPNHYLTVDEWESGTC